MSTQSVESSQQRQLLSDFIASRGISMRATETDRNPYMSDDMPGASHWRCTIKAGSRRMIVTFSMGAAHTGPPVLADVLDCLASDAAGYENTQGFEDWCGDYGYDADSRKAERTFKAVEKQAAALRRVLGDEDFNTLLWEVERQ